MTTENSKKQKVPEFIIPEEMKNINLPHESLKPLEPEIDIVSMMQKFKDILSNKDSDWTYQISVINYLRRIFKFDKQVFNQFFYGAKFYQKIIEFIDSVRSSLAKNALVLLNEIFSEQINQEEKSNSNSLITLIKSTIPHLISKINSNKSFIKADSNMCLESLVKNMKFFDVLLTFFQLMNTKKAKDAELLLELSKKMINNLGKEFFVQNSQFNELIKHVISFYESHKDSNVKQCKDILNCFIEVMTKEEFYKKMEKCTKKEKENVKIILETKIAQPKKKISSTSSMHFRKDINERKKNFKMSKCNEVKGNKSVSIKIVAKGKDPMELHSNGAKLNDENAQKNY
jgi:hypothetical protein